MPDKKLTSGVTGVLTSLGDTDHIPVTDNAAAPVLKKITWANVKAGLRIALGINDGWVPAIGTWTYASATTITVPSGAAWYYSVGDKLKWDANSVTLYAYVIAVTDTLLTVAGNTVTNFTITNNYSSRKASAYLFPNYFTYTPTGISATNVSMTGRYTVIGRRCLCEIYALFSGAITFTTFPTLPIPSSDVNIFSSAIFPSGCGGYYDQGTGTYPIGLVPSLVKSGTVINILRASDGASISATIPITWASSDGFYIQFEYFI
jgi:hypothetical protein